MSNTQSDSNLFQSLKWRCIGPPRGGRVVAVAGHPTEQAVFYFGACAGGVWKPTMRNILEKRFRRVLQQCCARSYRGGRC